MLIDLLNENLSEFKIKFEIESAVYDKKLQTLQLVLNYPNNIVLNNTIKKHVQDCISSITGSNVKSTIRYKKNFYDEDMLRDFIVDELRKEFPILEVYKKHITLPNMEECVLQILVDVRYKDMIEASHIKEYIIKQLYDTYKQTFDIVIEYSEGLIKIKEEVQDFTDIQTGLADEFKIEIKDVESYIGEKIDADFFPIASYTSPEEGVCICGKIVNLVENKTRPKVDENGKEKPERIYYSFEVKDYSGSMRVVYFPGKANLAKMQKLQNDSEIALFGNVEEDKFSAGLSFRPKVINLCILPSDFFNRIYSMPVPKTYTKVIPKAYVIHEQENLFSEQTEIQNPYLIQNDFVVFDLETTGVNYSSDKIIEIGAVKIVQGKLVETFSCLVNPECPIPPDATKVNNITDDDVKDAYTIKEVMPDFFKFCDGCVMVSYVIGFDFNFIDFNARALGYTFTNKTDDAFVMAKTKLKGLKNYKLTTVSKHLGVSLDNAHRAVYDAIATAEVMVKLLENY